MFPHEVWKLKVFSLWGCTQTSCHYDLVEFTECFCPCLIIGEHILGSTQLPSHGWHLPPSMRSKSGAGTLKQSEILLCPFPLCICLGGSSWYAVVLWSWTVIENRACSLFPFEMKEKHSYPCSLLKCIAQVQPPALPHGCYLKKTDLGWALHEALLFTKQMQRKALIWIIACL